MADQLATRFETVYNGHTISNVGFIRIKFKSPMSELRKVLKVALMVGKELNVKAIVGEEELIADGWMLFKLMIDRDGETTLVFETNSDLIGDFRIPEALLESLCILNIKEGEAIE